MLLLISNNFHESDKKKTENVVSELIISCSPHYLENITCLSNK